MILRRIAEHVKAQNWTAVALDFVIVVTGVFIGIQVSNWNAARADDRRLEEQIAAFAVELDGNIEKIETYRAFAVGQIEAINELRAAFAAAPDADPAKIDALIFNTLRVLDLQPQLAAFEDLSASGGLRRLSGTPLRRTIARWESDLLYVRRLDRDALAHRDDIVLPWVAANLSLAALGDEDGEQTSLGLAPSRFQNDIMFLANSVELENMLALRFILEAQIVKYSAELEQSTRALKTELEQREARQ
ncbi:MAG: hypothetical protein GC152_12585 [Alphaproteobacteria bacterium]|nr:hypothetical protein [Alphaproteobacteria bacterium]